MQELSRYIVSPSSSIKEAVGRMDEAGIGFCVCVDGQDKVIGVISDGDFRRGVLSGVSVDEKADEIINKNFRFLSSGYSKYEVTQIFKEDVVRHIPIIDDGKLVDIITEDAFFGLERGKVKASLDNPVVIMAGGKGKRLDPFTRIFPKPLIPIGDDPIIKVIMDKFVAYGMNDFYLSLNDKGRMIKAYFTDHEFPYSIQYIEEEKPLGTAGALKYLEGKFDQSFFVSNCDILIETDYEAILDYHIEGAYALTLVASMRNYVIPYGICDIDNGGTLQAIREKPEYDFLVNTGLYLLEPMVLNLIPDNTYFDMTDLINSVQKKSLKVGVFPISEKSWVDIGQWGEYQKAVKDLGVDR